MEHFMKLPGIKRPRVLPVPLYNGEDDRSELPKQLYWRGDLEMSEKIGPEEAPTAVAVEPVGITRRHRPGQLAL